MLDGGCLWDQGYKAHHCSTMRNVRGDKSVCLGGLIKCITQSADKTTLFGLRKTKPVLLLYCTDKAAVSHVGRDRDGGERLRKCSVCMDHNSCAETTIIGSAKGLALCLFPMRLNLT